MNWFSKHADALAVIGALAFAMWWMHTEFNGVNGKFAQIDSRFAEAELQAEKRFAAIEKDLAVIKTALIMKDIMPKELAKENQK